MVINGKMYVGPEMTLDVIYKMENLGATFQDAIQRPIHFFTAYLAVCMGKDFEAARKEIEAHLKNGGQLVQALNELTAIVSRCELLGLDK